MSEIRITTNLDGWRRLRDALLHNPARLLKRIGVLLLQQAQRAFTEQRFGDQMWPPRYPNQNGDKLNVAGALQDLSAGGTIKKRRFEARPVGRDTGALLRSLTPTTGMETGGDWVEVGSNLPYAGKFHAGGESRQPVTRMAKRNLAIALKRERRQAKKSGGAKPLQKRLGFLFRTDELVTNSPSRPFVGMTDEAAEKIHLLLGDEAREAAGGHP